MSLLSASRVVPGALDLLTTMDRTANYSSAVKGIRGKQFAAILTAMLRFEARYEFERAFVQGGSNIGIKQREVGVDGEEPEAEAEFRGRRPRSLFPNI